MCQSTREFCIKGWLKLIMRWMHHSVAQHIIIHISISIQVYNCGCKTTTVWKVIYSYVIATFPPARFCLIGKNHSYSQFVQEHRQITHTHARTHSLTRTHARTHPHPHTRARARARAHTRARAHARPHAHTRTHARTHARARTHTLSLSFAQRVKLMMALWKAQTILTVLI